MEGKVLQSVIEITRHRDLDSLELAFVATLKQMLPLSQIGLYHVSASRPDHLVEIVNLEGSENDGVRHRSDSRLVPASDQVTAAIRSMSRLAITCKDGSLKLVIPIACGEKAEGAVILRGDPALQDQSDLIDGLARIYSNYMTILHEAKHDRLTGLFNRRTFDDGLARMLTAMHNNTPTAQSTNVSAWLAVLDVDHFKKINDTYGHVYGDEILLLIAQEMRTFFAADDLLFRVGGEEFVVILTPRGSEEAHQVLDAYRQRIADRVYPQGLRVTVSLGYARIRKSDFPRHVYELADKALYHAKESGRNRCCSYDSLLADGHFTEEDSSGSIELF